MHKDNSKYTIENIHHLIENMRVFCSKEDIQMTTNADFRKIRTSDRTPEKNSNKKARRNV